MDDAPGAANRMAGHRSFAPQRPTPPVGSTSAARGNVAPSSAPAPPARGNPAPPGRNRGAALLALTCLALLVALSVAYATWGASAPAPGPGTAAAVGQAVAGPAANVTPEDTLLSGPARLGLWLGVLLLLTVGWLALGRVFSQSWRAIFVNRQRRMSLSQTQFVLWSLLMGSALLALFLIHLRGPASSKALDIGIPLEAGALLGVGALSFGGTAAIHMVKRRQDPSDAAKDRILRRRQRAGRLPASVAALAPALEGRPLGKGLAHARGDPDLAPAVEAAELAIDQEADGLLARNRSLSEANALNLLQGDEVANASDMDLGKIQMAFFTAVLLVGYFVLLWRLFLFGVFEPAGPSDTRPLLGSLPQVSEGVVALLGASHLGYLATKGAGATRAAPSA